MKFFVTGAAGFIGSNLVDRLLADGHDVVGYDNLSTGQLRFLDVARQSRAFKLVEGDLLDLDSISRAMAGCEKVVHLAANADVRFGTDHPFRDLEQNTIGTFNVLEAMRANNILSIIFSSTGSVYGETKVIPSPEDAPFPIQTSLYGASKVACEGLISAYCEGFGFKGLVFRFVSILGPRYTHGHVFDFCKQLRSDPNNLLILGNGKQRKSYLHVKDCINAILTALEAVEDQFAIFNLGVDQYCEVHNSVAWIASEMQATPTYSYSGGDRGWIGDNPFIFLDCSRIRDLGWKPQYTIEEGVRETLRWLMANQWVLDARD